MARSYADAVVMDNAAIRADPCWADSPGVCHWGAHMLHRMVDRDISVKEAIRYIVGPCSSANIGAACYTRLHSHIMSYNVSSYSA